MSHPASLQEDASSSGLNGPRPSNVWLLRAARGHKLGHQGFDPRPDVVADGSHGLEVLPSRVIEVAVLVALAREDGTGIAAAHRDDHVGLQDARCGQWLRLLGCDVDALFGHGRNRGRVDLAGWLGPGGENGDPVTVLSAGSE